MRLFAKDVTIAVIVIASSSVQFKRPAVIYNEITTNELRIVG
jgi:hypothetical protein